MGRVIRLDAYCAIAALRALIGTEEPARQTPGPGIELSLWDLRADCGLSRRADPLELISLAGTLGEQRDVARQVLERGLFALADRDAEGALEAREAVLYSRALVHYVASTTSFMAAASDGPLEDCLFLVVLCADGGSGARALCVALPGLCAPLSHAQLVRVAQRAAALAGAGEGACAPTRG
ncbi:hypothetical protein J2T57_001546 [Natronocella acetinitrilica]|uniref:Uncharacterized protein n=1 Tax=Natronocella acetinitrilica TaxID=414046 RepID=A0AAE3G3L5_9GAMM|nr:hypothetical protein [Natronocella acetinitrilica]MCP1674444.1 hypothetical protein [Natronocella acetinitrilica]